MVGAPGPGRDDDCGLAVPFQERSGLLDDRVGSRATSITSQLPIAHWHTYLGDPTFADGIIDHVVRAAHKPNLKGESMRKKKKYEAVRAVRLIHRRPPASV